MNPWTDNALLLHAVATFVLAILIFRAAYIKHRYRMWRFWPPLLLISWGIMELADSAIFFRRWLEIETSWGPIEYGRPIHASLVSIGTLATVVLILRIFKGDAADESKDARDKRQDDRTERQDLRDAMQDEQQVILDETNLVLAERNKILSVAGADVNARSVDIGVMERNLNQQDAEQTATGVLQDAVDEGQDERDYQVSMREDAQDVRDKEDR